MGSNYRKTENETPVFCPYCGGKVQEGYKLCPYCGKELPEKLVVGSPSKNVRAAVGKTEKAENEDILIKQEDQPEEKQKKPFNKMVLIVILAVCILGGIGGVVILKAADGKSNSIGENDTKSAFSLATSSEIMLDVSSQENSVLESSDLSDTEFEISQTPTPTPLAKVKVPSLVGKTVSEAEEAAKKKKLGLEEDGKKADNELAKGTIIEQDPIANKKVEEGTVIHYIVSSGPVQKKVPDIINLKREEAKKALEKVGFKKYKILYQQDSKTASGRVFRVSPKVGKKTAVTKTITFYISTGSVQPTEAPSTQGASTTITNGSTNTPASQTVLVKDYRNISVSEAKNRCAKDGLTVETTLTYKEGFGDGIVLDQNIFPNTDVAKGTKIVLEVNSTGNIDDHRSTNSSIEELQPEVPQQDDSQSETLQPETPQSETPQPETTQPETPKPETTQPETPQPDTPQPETPQPEAPWPETPQPDTPQLETSQPET